MSITPVPATPAAAPAAPLEPPRVRSDKHVSRASDDNRARRNLRAVFEAAFREGVPPAIDPDNNNRYTIYQK